MKATTGRNTILQVEKELQQGYEMFLQAINLWGRRGPSEVDDGTVY